MNRPGPHDDYLRTVNRFLPGAPKIGSLIAFWLIARAWARYGLGS